MLALARPRCPACSLALRNEPSAPDIWSCLRCGASFLEEKSELLPEIGTPALSGAGAGLRRAA